MIFTFKAYEVMDSGVELIFINPDPGPGKFTDYTLILTDAEISGITTKAQMAALITSKLQRKILATGIANKLDQLIGQTITVQ